MNPNVDHPRWTQATERRLGEFGKRNTLMFNGYGDQVASLYAGMDLKKNLLTDAQTTRRQDPGVPVVSRADFLAGMARVEPMT